jgi:hypothetical protein
MNPAMATIDQFPLEAEIALTELRSEATLTKRLRTHHRLRVRRRNELIGVLIDAEAWHHLVRYVGRLEAELEAELERVENSEVRAIIEARLPGARFETGSPVLVEEIDHECERIVSENLRSQA